MSYVVTLVSSKPDVPLQESYVEQAIGVIQKSDIQVTCAPVFLAPGKAADIGVAEPAHYRLLQSIRGELDNACIDVFCSPVEGRRKKLVLADMDSTIVVGETLDDLAEYAGLKEKIAEITARAMNGELDFHSALYERVKLLKGLSTDAMDKTLEAMKISPGAEIFIQTMRKYGAHCVLVSGGFTFFTEAVAKKVGFNDHHGNILKIDGDVLMGDVEPPILDKHAKVEYLRRYMAAGGLKPEQCLTIGDGANDIPMLEMAGLGIGYQPKDAVSKQIDNQIVHGDLTAALYAQGIVPPV